MQQLLHSAKQGDIIYIHFSGHGQRITDCDEDETDGLDEAWIPYDAHRLYLKDVYEGEKHITDDYLNEYLTQLRQAIGGNGKIVVIDKVVESEYIKGECLQVSVYMDFFNVHVNYWPIDGNVTYYKYHPGKYMLAFLPKASELNEHTSVAVRSTYGDVFFKQIAGTFARRIVCHANPGADVVKSDECGIIKFGSRIDMYLPLDAVIKVKLGDTVRGSETVIAELNK